MNNNPVLYNDPNGDIAPVVVAAIIGGAIGGTLNVVTHWDDITRGGFGEGIKAFSVGAVGGAIAGASGGGVIGAGFVKGFLIGGASAALGDIVTQGGNAAFFNDALSAERVGKAFLFGRIVGGAIGHLIKHRDVLGFGNVSAQQAQKMLPQLRGAANQLLNNANPALTRVGQWHQHSNAIMRISNGKMLVTQADGTFITVINKTSNNWYQLAKPLH